MRAYWAYIKCTMRLTLRDRVVLFFNYLMPLLFFVAFGEGLGARTSFGSLAQVVSMVLMFGVLGTGFFGGGLRATMDREAGILRRFKVAPISPSPILAASLVTGWVVFLPSVFVFLALARWRYGMEQPVNLGSLLIVVTVGVLAFRSLGLIIASVVNSMQESQIIAQLLYLPMLMLSGATVPLNIMPEWLQTTAHFLPSTYLYMGTQGILVKGETAWDNRAAVGALLVTMAAGLVISMKLFRWEKEEKVKGAAKLWVAGVLAPFLALGAWQMHGHESLRKTRILDRQMRRSQTWLIRDARIFTGDGEVIEQGGVLIRGGRIAQVYRGTAPDAKDLRAEPLEASGRTVMPALIDSGVNLAGDGLGKAEHDAGELGKRIEHSIAAYLYCGVAAVRTAPDGMGLLRALRERLAAGELPGAEVFEAGGPVALSLTAAQAAGGGTGLLEESLVQQVLGPAKLSSMLAAAGRMQGRGGAYDAAVKTLRARAASGDLPSPAGGGGRPLVVHGPGLAHELKLWVEAGIPARKSLEAATWQAARRLGAGARLGRIRPGYDATLIIVDGNPVEDINAAGRVSAVLMKGERAARQNLLDENKNGGN